MKKLEIIEKYGEEWYEEHILKQVRKHNRDHKEERSEYNKQYYQDNREDVLAQHKQWQKDNPIQWRANNLLNNYRRSDENANRGECTLTEDWIVKNIITSDPSRCVAVISAAGKRTKDDYKMTVYTLRSFLTVSVG